MYSANIFTKVEVDVRESHPRRWVLAHFSYSKRNSDEPIVSKLLVWGEAENLSLLFHRMSSVFLGLKALLLQTYVIVAAKYPIWLVHMGNWKFQLGLKTVILEHKLLFVAMEFHQFPVHGRFGGWWFLCSSWTSQPISSHLKVVVGVFFQTTYRIICTDIILLEWWRFRNMQLFRYGSKRPSQHV